jgi:hypothetical protein
MQEEKRANKEKLENRRISLINLMSVEWSEKGYVEYSTVRQEEKRSKIQNYNINKNWIIKIEL